MTAAGDATPVVTGPVEPEEPPAGPLDNLVTALVALGLGIAAVVGATALGVGSPAAPGPGTWPLLVGVVLTALSAVLAARARSNKVTPDELTGGTFTITNIGSNGALFDTPIIVQPQAGILGTGAVVRRPVVVTDSDGNDTIAIRSMAYLPLTYDHRLVDGADAGRFLTTIKQRLEEGNFEDELGL